jgi:aminobenzoyl-glutamate transport protein
MNERIRVGRRHQCFDGGPDLSGCAAYRLGDSPVNAITPLMVYLPFIHTIAQRYQKDPGIGTIISLMPPFVIVILIAWILFFVVWFALNILLGPSYLPQI